VCFAFLCLVLFFIMATQAISAERKIDDLCSFVGISPQGKAWLDKALDPFKDILSETTVSGFPDMYSGLSVIQEFNFVLEVKAPGVAAWDAHICFDGFENSDSVRLTTNIGNGFLTANGQGVAVIPYGGCNIRTVDSGALMDMATVKSILAPPNTSYTGGKGRVIAKAFEVHDSSAEIVKQGAVILWKDTMSNPVFEKKSMNFISTPAISTAGAVVSSYSIQSRRPLPLTPVQALAFPNSVEYDAKDGAYVVAPMVDVELPPQSIETTEKTIPFIAENGLFVPPLSIAATTGIVFTTGSNCVKGSHGNCGAYFIGLNKDGVLTVNVKYVVEFFPETTSSLLTMARPSCSYDPKALALYSASMRHLPPGTRVKNNPAGEWIKFVANVLGSFGVPGMGLVSGAVDLYSSTKKESKQAKMEKRMQKGNGGYSPWLPNNQIQQGSITSAQGPRQRGPRPTDSVKPLTYQIVKKKPAENTAKKVVVLQAKNPRPRVVNNRSTKGVKPLDFVVQNS
jgi:hypothetical protein